MPDPQSPDEWMVLARRKEAVARAMVEDRKNCAEAFTAAGFAVEYALKALIMRTERLNGWPSRDMRPDLHQHAIRVASTELVEIWSRGRRAEIRP